MAANLEKRVERNDKLLREYGVGVQDYTSPSSPRHYSDESISSAEHATKNNSPSFPSASEVILRHEWKLWHDKPDHTNSNTSYSTRLTALHHFSTIGGFYSCFNNLPLALMANRSAIYIFKHTVMPSWEDPRNLNGGSWTFRIPRSTHAKPFAKISRQEATTVIDKEEVPMAEEFLHSLCLLAIGEQLQDALSDVSRDDICGVSYAIRPAAVLISVWNRYSENEDGIKGVLEKIVPCLPAELKDADGQPRKEAVYYKRHAHHAGFAGEKRGQAK